MVSLFRCDSPSGPTSRWLPRCVGCRNVLGILLHGVLRIFSHPAPRRKLNWAYSTVVAQVYVGCQEVIFGVFHDITCIFSHPTLQFAQVDLNHSAPHCNTQHTATHCNTLQHAATHCNTLQHTATYYNTPHHTLRLKRKTT